MCVLWVFFLLLRRSQDVTRVRTSATWQCTRQGQFGWTEDFNSLVNNNTQQWIKICSHFIRVYVNIWCIYLLSHPYTHECEAVLGPLPRTSPHAATDDIISVVSIFEVQIPRKAKRRGGRRTLICITQDNTMRASYKILACVGFAYTYIGWKLKIREILECYNHNIDPWGLRLREFYVTRPFTTIANFIGKWL